MTISAMHMTGHLVCTIVVCTDTTSCAARFTASLFPWYITKITPAHPSSTASTSSPFPGRDSDDAMSFGWSAGDIAQAITVIVKVVKALDDAEGAPGDYRKAITFLDGVKRTLHQLHFFTKLGKYPAYGDEIRRHVEQIKGPLEKFLALINKYEPSLGRTAAPGRRHNMYRKLRWEYSNAPKALQREIKDNLEELNRLLAGFTLDVVVQVQQKQDSLPDDLRQEFTNLTSIVGQHILTIRADLQANCSERTQNHSQVLSELEMYHRITRLEHLQPMQNEIKALHFQGKENHLQLNEKLDQLSIAILNSTRKNGVVKPRPGIGGPGEVSSNHSIIENPIIAHMNHGIGALGKETLYMMFLYIAQLLQKLLQRLAASHQPTRALTTTLLATYNITFQDALGRPPRVLQYEIFSDFKMFQTFLHESFSTIPGRRWVETGSFLLTNTSAGKRLTAKNWSRSISRGCHIDMDMLVNLPKAPAQGDTCFVAECRGTLQRDETLLTLTNPPKKSLKCNICLRNCVAPPLPPTSITAQASTVLTHENSHEHAEVQEEALHFSLVSAEDIIKFQRFIQRSTSVEPNGPKPASEELGITAEEFTAQVSIDQQVMHPGFPEDESDTRLLIVSRKTTPEEPDVNHVIGRATFENWYCCWCDNGPMRGDFVDFCPDCRMDRCGDCPYE